MNSVLMVTGDSLQWGISRERTKRAGTAPTARFWTMKLRHIWLCSRAFRIFTREFRN